MVQTNLPRDASPEVVKRCEGVGWGAKAGTKDPFITVFHFNHDQTVRAGEIIAKCNNTGIAFSCFLKTGSFLIKTICNELPLLLERCLGLEPKNT